MVSGDLVTLSVLLVCADADQSALWRQGAALASVPTDLVEATRADAACMQVRGRPVDIVLLDERLPAADRELVLAAAREEGRPLTVLLCAAASQVAASACDGIALRPASSDQARALVDRCIKARLPSRVLVVDDSAGMRTLVRRILAASRFPLEIEEAGGGSAALKQVLLGHFDIVMLDSDMPGLDGLATMAELKRSRPRLAVVMMVARRDHAVETRARAAGAVAILHKPFYPADVDAALQEVFGLGGRPG